MKDTENKKFPVPSQLFGATTGYKKYKWFYTSTGKLVVGGKSAVQNDELLKEIEKAGEERIVMHTSTPGSPFCVITCDVKKVNKKDFEECAIFTGCFSRAWKQNKRFAEVHVFSSNQLAKEKRMKSGTWKVLDKVGKVKVELRLAIVKQKNVYRGVPVKSVLKKEVLLEVCPGKVDKAKMIDKIMKDLGLKNTKKKDELMGALPAGGVRIC